MTLTSHNSVFTFWADFDIGCPYHFNLFVQGFSFIMFYLCEWTRDQEIKGALRNHLKLGDIVRRKTRSRVHQVREEEREGLTDDDVG